MATTRICSLIVARDFTAAQVSCGDSTMRKDEEDAIP